MSPSYRRQFPDIRPESSEVDALRLAARYLRRAGTRTATELLDCRAASDDLPLRFAIRDNLVAAADLCDGLIDFHQADKQPQEH